MKCPNCGKEIADDSKFCEFCGTEISKPKSMKVLGIVLAVLLGLYALGVGTFYVYDMYKQHKKEVAEVKAAQEEAERQAEEALRLAEEAEKKAEAEKRNAEEEKRKLEQAEKKAGDMERKAAEEKKKAERAYKEKRKKELILQGYVDLGLPSGTLWKPQNEKGYYTYSDAVSRFGKNVPSIDQLWELLRKCKWELDTSKSLKKYNVRGPNGNTIEVPLLGYMDCDGHVHYKNVLGHLQSSTLADSEHAWTLRIFDDYLGKDWGGEMCDACCVRLAAKP